MSEKNSWCFACSPNNPIGLHLEFQEINDTYQTSFTGKKEIFERSRNNSVILPFRPPKSMQTLQFRIFKNRSEVFGGKSKERRRTCR